MSGIWAIVPVKEFEGAKHRLSSALSPEERRVLAATMLEDVLDAVSAVRELAGVLVVTVDPAATSLAARYGARVVTEGARDGHTGAVTAAARLLVREGEGRHDDDARRHSAPLVRPRSPRRSPRTAAAPAFTIVPAHDDLGSNTIVCRRPTPFRCASAKTVFTRISTRRAPAGSNRSSSAIRASGWTSTIPSIWSAFLRMSPPVRTRTLAFLEQSGVAGRLLATSQSPLIDRGSSRGI